ncbi:MAG: hypothetical protein ACTSRI_20775 [Promethearchaeota archaeon]
MKANILKKFLDRIKNNLYFIIPLICIGLMALYEVVSNNFMPVAIDFRDRYNAGELILNDPINLYNKVRYYYLPSFATVLSFTLSLLPYLISYFSYFIINTILVMLMTLEYNKILILMDVKKKFHRFLFLMVISNGYVIMFSLYNNNFKYVAGVLILLVIRRELQYRKNQKEKDLKYYFINYNLLFFGIGIIPPLIFFVFIYIFSDIRLNEIFKKENLKLICIAILVFSIQNFLFFLYPTYILDFINSYAENNATQRGNRIPFFYTEQMLIFDNNQFFFFTIDDNQIFFFISTFFLVVSTLLLIFNNKLQVEEKFAYFSLVSLIISAWAWKSILVLFPLSLLLFIPFLNQEKKGIEFIKKNIFILIGLISLASLYFFFPNFTIFKYFPFLKEEHFIFLMNLRAIIPLIIYIGCFLILRLKKLKSIKNNKEMY